MSGADPHRALIAAIEHRYGPLDNLVSTSRPWSSATFAGARHELSFDSARAAEIFASIGEADLPMAGHFVSDIAPVRCDNQHLTLEALTIAEA